MNNECNGSKMMKKLVGPAGFEPATSAMSRRRHNP